MQDYGLFGAPVLIGALLGVVALGIGIYAGRRRLAESRDAAARILAETTQDAESKHKEILVAGREKAIQFEEERDRRERELDEREAAVEQRNDKLSHQASEIGRERKELQARGDEVQRLEESARETNESAEAKRSEVLQTLERTAGLSVEQAREELISKIEAGARRQAEQRAQLIEDEARENAERRAINLLVQASQRVNIRDVAESTVSFIELPSDEMKGRIIGKEGRNIRALEMATGIDLVVDDTPRSILISSFDPIRREVARIAIDRLVADGRIHPARIEEVVQSVRDEIDDLIEERGVETALGVGISDLHPKIARLVGRMRYHTNHGQNLLQHSLETAMIAGFMAEETGGAADVARRAALLHEIDQVADNSSDNSHVSSADLCSKYSESTEVVETIRHLQQDVKAKSLEALLVGAANRLSDNRPGARKENLAVFIERLRRLEGIATRFSGVQSAYAVKAGKEIRVIVDAERTSDRNIYELSKQIARALEKELNYPGQIKVNVVRTTRSVRFAT